MGTRSARLRSARVLTLASVIALLAMLLPATAGVALGHAVTTGCDRITNDRTYGVAVVKDHTTGAVVIASLADGATQNIAAGTYDIMWSRDGFTQTAVVVGKCSPSITTVANPSTGKAGVAMTVGDSATLSGAVIFAAGSSVSFSLYSGTTCTGTPVVSGSGAIGAISAGKANAAYSRSWTPSVAGTYTWGIAFTGDTYNYSYSACGGSTEIVTISKASPTIATLLSKESGQVGDKVHDTATLTGATSTAGGTVKYTVYTDSACTLVAQDGGTVVVTNGLVPDSKTIGFDSVGTWYWQAVYSGDANNAGAISSCRSEILVIDPTPFESFEGETATPSVHPTSTPFESFEGATATTGRIVTLPPTSSDGNGTSNTAIPLFALMLCLVAGVAGIAAVQAERRSIRR
jgi:hypothetical protein